MRNKLIHDTKWMRNRFFPNVFKPHYFCGLPWNINETKLLDRLPQKVFISEFLNAKMVTDKEIMQKLTENFTQFLTAMSYKNSEKLMHLCEQNFAQKILSNLKALPEIPIYEPDNNISGRVIDHLFIKGVNINRSENGYNFDYALIKDLEEDGIRYFIHKVLLNFNEHNMEHEYENEIKKNTTLQAEISRKNRQILLRTVVQFNNCGKFILPKSHTEAKSKYHIAVYENQLLPPTHVKSIVDKNAYINWLKEFKFNNENWKIIDCDNFMNGNSFFKKLVKESEKPENINKSTAKSDPMPTIDEKMVESLISKIKSQMKEVPKPPQNITSDLSRMKSSTKKTNRKNKK